jgi:hypothetical protein
MAASCLAAVMLLGGLAFWLVSSRQQAHRAQDAAQRAEARKALAVATFSATNHPAVVTTEAPKLFLAEPPLLEPVRLAPTPTDQPVEKPLETASAETPVATDTARAATTEPKPAPQPPAKLVLGASESRKGKPLAGEDIFKDGVIPRLVIEVPRAAAASLRQNSRKYVSVTIREGNMVYTNVALRLKGSAGSRRDFDDTPSLTINFDKFAEGQTFHKLKKIHLNASPQDRSLLSEKLSRELFEAAGIPTPRAGNAAVTFNGRDMGVFVLVEGINKQFLKRYFTDVTGNVYDGKGNRDVTDSLPTNAGDNPADKSRLRALASAARQPVGERLASLEKTLDLDRFITFVAMETILCHWDGYTMNKNNWRLYHDRDTDRMIFLPHGMDQMVGRGNSEMVPRLNGLVARAALEIPEVRQRYENRFTELVTNVLRADVITARIKEVAQKIELALMQTDPQAADAHKSKANSLARRFQQRAAFLQRRVAPTADPVFLGQDDSEPNRPRRVQTVAGMPKRPALALQTNVLAGNAAMKLTAWEPKTDLGEAKLAREKDAKGVDALHISTAGGCTASWRTNVQLPPGKYRFEARVKTQGVVLNPDDARAGAGLRVSRYRTGQKNKGNRDWTPVNFDLEVREDQGEVELVCELRADQGDVWFDLDSLKLSRR